MNVSILKEEERKYARKGSLGAVRGASYTMLNLWRSFYRAGLVRGNCIKKVNILVRDIAVIEILSFELDKIRR